MKIFHSLDQAYAPSTQVALTIGNFDGVHLGHLAVLNRLKEVSKHPVVLTFSNHPFEVLKKKPILHLSTLAHRLQLLQDFGIASTFLIPFTETFSKQSAHDFLRRLKQSIPFTHLVLGHDAIIGHDRKQNLQEEGEILGFSVEYLTPVYANKTVISSSVIRKWIQTGELDQVSALLGRPYSILATVEPGAQKGGKLGFHTANLPVEGLALPPLGVYAVRVKIGSQSLPAIANLGHAPTLHKERPPYLEVHLIDDNRDLYGQNLEVFFIRFIRPEKQFASVSDLKEQIRQDIAQASQILS